MMTALAIVTGVERHGKQYEIDLSCEQQTSCSSCSSQKSCGTGVVTKAIGNKSLSWHLRTEKNVQVGQVVEIGFPESSLIKSAMAVYLLPLFGLILGAMVGHFLLIPLTAGGEGIVILASVLFAAGGMWFAKRLSKPLEDESKRQVTLIRVLGEPIQ
ncbi:SoxR reducing system RseC family protein [Vibrio parahaemolyticus]|uniref:SoxR reducing system RseC family protein n=1 Tax=Vibrio parahaemolyticus TaxID=670 RepID=UPI000944BD78|nr:SoxR reducing system RseC family protein [Vibrio parahaemolyticus]EGR1557354.1 transcriptional regulator [Vibrio parahaemolyticus]EID4329797.1 SoxR reducing system RseC family protein [Vibrio parahaemolyticus]OKY40272.1 transcriptional regulator [Vibrio parahaemolyticus]OKY44555.1 transcriptional regulator [Vibrio parahaemolyticus]TOB74143.1 transcriptional regulator [Vibrio parahaemolyticus]